MDRGPRIFLIMLGCALLAAVTFWYLDIGEKTFASPQECFDAATAALKKNDMRGFCECLSTDSRDLVAASAVIDEYGKKQDGAKTDEQKDHVRAMGEVFAQHGLTDAFLAKAQKEALTISDFQAPLNEKVAAAQIVLDPVSDRNGLIADVFKVGMKGAKSENPFDRLKNARLAKVQVTGRKAVAEVSVGDMPAPINFVKQGEGWRIDLFPEQPKRQMPPGMFQHP